MYNLYYIFNLFNVYLIVINIVHLNWTFSPYIYILLANGKKDQLKCTIFYFIQFIAYNIYNYNLEFLIIYNIIILY